MEPETPQESRPPEILINEPENVEQFYKDVFGRAVLTWDKDRSVWMIHDREDDTDPVILTRNPELEHLMQQYREPRDMTGSFVANITVEDVDEIRTRIIAHKGTCDLVTETPRGKLAFCTDPAGNMFSVSDMFSGDDAK